MKRSRIAILLSALGICGFAGFYFVSGSSTKLDPQIQAAAKAILKMTLPEGRFIYLTDSVTGKSPHRYNIIRHAGTIYSLGQYAKAYPENKAVRETIRKSAHYMLATSTCHVNAFDLPVKTRTICTDPYLTDRLSERALAQLGGAGLGLVALVTTERVHPGEIAKDILTDLGEFLLYMQKPDGDYFHRFDFKTQRRDNEFSSLFYPGEAALGLTMLYKHDRQKKWLKGALKAMRFLAKSRQNLAQVPTDNWALIATEELLSLGSEIVESDREVLLHHARQIVDANLHGQIVDPKNPLYGAFSADGDSTVTATRLEGLLAAYGFIRQSQLRSRIRAAAEAGMIYLLKTQATRGAFPGAFTYTSTSTETRIDYVQHGLSAMLRHATVL